MPKDNFENAVTAFEQVKQTVAVLKEEHATVIAEINTVSAELQSLPLAYLPLEELKSGILDFIDASGERYAEKQIRAAIASFATGSMRGLGSDMVPLLGKPLRYADIERAISGNEPCLGRAQLLTPDKSAFDDQVLYFFISSLIRDGLRKLMDSMSPAEFGYDKIHPDKIGSTRFERRLTITSLEERLDELQTRKADLEQKLHAIGSPVSPTVPGGQ